MDAKQYTPPEFVYDLLAEQALLKIALHGDRFALQLCGDLGHMMWSNKHQQLAAVLASRYANDQQVDLVSVLGHLSAAGLITKVDGPFLHEVYSGPGDHAGVRWYGDRIRKLAARRSLREAAIRAQQRMDYAWGTGDDDEERVMVEEFRGMLDEVEAQSRPEGLPQPTPMSEFLDGPTDYDWIVPGLLERGERTIVTGTEGTGKSELVSQLGVCMAGGVHPFTGRILGNGDRGIKVTVLDFENSAIKSRRRLRRIVGKVDRCREIGGAGPADWKSQMSIDIRPEGIDLLTPRDAVWFEHAIATTQPDLLVAGPLYKLFEGDPNDETIARKITATLDRLRARYGFALLTEAHPNKSEDGAVRRMAPIGSSLWLRWPEYGFGIRRSRKATNPKRADIVDVVSWRGAREDRQWPDELFHGSRLPWEPPADHDPLPDLDDDEWGLSQ